MRQDLYDDGRVEIASSGTDTMLPVETDRLSSWYLTYVDQKKDNSGENEEGKTDDNSGSSGEKEANPNGNETEDPAENITPAAQETKTEPVITPADNLPMDVKTEKVGDGSGGEFTVEYAHKIPFFGKGKITPELFGENGADKATVKAVKKATKGDKGIPFEENPYYVKNTDTVTPMFKKDGSLKSVKVNINNKNYKAKKEEYDYDKTEKLIRFKGKNLNGSYKVS